jgi:hypothetical protein
VPVVLELRPPKRPEVVGGVPGWPVGQRQPCGMSQPVCSKGTEWSRDSCRVKSCPDAGEVSGRRAVCHGPPSAHPDQTGAGGSKPGRPGPRPVCPEWSAPVGGMGWQENDDASSRRRPGHDRKEACPHQASPRPRAGCVMERNSRRSAHPRSRYVSEEGLNVS